LNDGEKLHLFRKVQKKETDELQAEEDLPVKIVKAYAKMKVKAEKRKKRKKKILGKSKWKPKTDDAVLVRCQPTSDTSEGIIGKFRRPYEGPYKVSKLMNPYMCELQDKEGRTRGVFHLSHLKPYLLHTREYNDHGQVVIDRSVFGQLKRNIRN
jgi:translation initiation factor IF-1